MKTSVTLPDELFECLKARAVQDNTSVSALLARGGEVVLGDAEPVGVSGELNTKLAAAIRRAEQAEARLGELVVTIERLESGREVGARLPPATRRVDAARHHSSGPVLASAVPVVDGNVSWSNLKGKR